MATLTLGKSVTIDQVASKKGDAVFVERRRRVVAPGARELRDEPASPTPARNAADEKLRAVLEAARAREEERKAREAAEEAQRLAREAEIARETREYEQVKEQLAAREGAPAADTVEPAPASKKFQNNMQPATRRTARGEEDDARPSKFNNGKNRDFKKSGKISLHDIVMGGGDDDDDEIGLRGANRRRSEASLKRFRERRAQCLPPHKRLNVLFNWEIR